MKKLQIKMPSGSWSWVVGYNGHGVITTTSKRKAMPERTYWNVKSMDVLKKRYPDHEYRLAETTEEK